MRFGALILAGGQSVRMGQPKESLPFGPGTLLHRVCTTLLECSAPVVVVARDALQLLPEVPGGVEIITDRPPSRGPLAAIASGLDHMKLQHGFGERDAVFVTGCDSPFLSGAAVRWLMDQLGDHDLVMPAPGSVLQPLCAIYRIAVAGIAADLLARDIRSPRALATAVTTARLLTHQELAAYDPELRFLRNVNTPDEYDRARGEDRPDA